MIQPLRTVHRRAFVALAIVLPVILAAGLGARRLQPASAAPELGLPASAHLTRRSDTLWHRHAIRSEFYRDPNHAQMVYVVLRPVQELSEPDLLLYWSSSEPQGHSLPDHIQLLGALDPGRTFVLPRDTSGQLILYSLAHQAIVDTASLEKLP